MKKKIAAKKPKVKPSKVLTAAVLDPVDLYPVLGVRLYDVDGLLKDPRNARTHDERNVATIEASLKRFGQRKNIVVTADGEVKAGNGTLEAARRLGWKQIAGAPAPVDEAEHRAYALADNRSADLASWDDRALAVEVADLMKVGVDVVALGWSESELAMMKAALAPPIPPAEFPTYDLDVTVNCKCPKCGYQWSTGK